MSTHLAVLTPIQPAGREPSDNGATLRIRGYSTRIIALGILVALIYYGQLFLITLIAALVMAFILEPFVMLIMRLRFSRGVASFLACSVAVLGVYLIGLGVFTQMAELVDDLPSYSKRINDLFERVSVQLEGMQSTVSQVLPRRLQDQNSWNATAAVQPPSAVNPLRRRKPGDPLPVQPAPPVQEVRIQEPRANVVIWLYHLLQQFYNQIGRAHV